MREKLPVSMQATVKGMIYFLRCMLAALVIGIAVGAVGSLFSITLKFVLELREKYTWLLFALPAAGVIIAALYAMANEQAHDGTDGVIQSIRTGEALAGVMAPLIFVATTLTHLCGGSSGREGAALQLGGSMGNTIVRIATPNARLMRVGVICGMSAAFSALFGTPIAATIFALELASVGILYYSLLAPCALSAITAAMIAQLCGLRPESLAVGGDIPPLDAFGITRTLVLAAVCAVASVVMCVALHRGGALYKRFLPNVYIRAAAGGAIVIALTLILGTRDYLGAGMNVIERAVCEGEAVPAAFLLKLVFTVATLGAGFKGGEIVPAFFVGATLGCVVGPLLGLPPAFSAALGMIALFCGVTNCPIAAMVISFELFGYIRPVYFLITVAISYTLSGYYSLYRQQKIVYGKLENEYVDRATH